MNTQLDNSSSGGIPPGPGFDRSAIAIRQLWPHESAVFAAHLARLDEDDLRLRFGSTVNKAFLARYAREAIAAEGVVKGAFVDGICRGVGEARMLDRPDYDVEAAFSVERTYQGHGMGGMLFRRVVRAAANRGGTRVYMICLHSNQRMIRLARNHEADIRTDPDGVIAEIVRNPDSIFSAGTELFAESLSYLLTVPIWSLRKAASNESGPADD